MTKKSEGEGDFNCGYSTVGSFPQSLKFGFGFSKKKIMKTENHRQHCNSVSISFTKRTKGLFYAHILQNKSNSSKHVMPKHN